MAIQTLRDLAFKISMNVEMSKLKQADKAVDDFRAKVVKMQRSVSRDMDIVNRRLNNIDTFKAVQRINKMTQATDKLKEAIGVATGSVSPKTTTGDGNDKKKTKNKREPQFTLPHLNQWSNWTSKTTLLKQTLLAGYYSTLLKVHNVGLKINHNDEIQAKLINKKNILTQKLSGSLSKIENIIGKSNYKLIGGVKGLGKLALISAKVAIALKLMRMSQNAYNQSLEVYKDMNDGLVRQEAFFANALKYREQVMGEALHTGAKSYEEYSKIVQKSLDATRKNIDTVTKETIINKKQLTLFTGQLASFQINTDLWFGGEQGLKNMRIFADAIAVLQNKLGTRDEALRTANMIGKAFTLGHFGQLARNGIVVSPKAKEQIKQAKTEAEKLNILLQELKNNVENYNKALLKTPQGKIINIQSQIDDQYYKLGQHMIFLKIQLKELYQSWLPIISFITRVGGAVIGVFVKIITVITFLFTNVKKVSEKLESLMSVIKVLGAMLLVVFFPAYAGWLALLLLIEDFWVYLNNGESVIGNIIEWFKFMWKSIKDGYNDMMKYLSEKWEQAKNKWFDMKKIIATNFHNMINSFKNLFSRIGEVIKESLQSVFDWINKKIDQINIFKKIKLPNFGNKGSENPLLPQNDIQKIEDTKSTKITKLLNLPSVTVNLDMSNSKADITKIDIQEAVMNGLDQAFTDNLIQVGVDW